MTTTKYTDSGISPRTNVWAAREMLKHAIPVIVLDKVAKTVRMPKNRTKTIKFRRPVVFTAADTPLVEGVTPNATQFSYEDVSVALQQYGEYVEITDIIEDMAEDPVLSDASVQCGENIGRTLEALNYGVARGGTSVFYANGSARSAVNTTLNLDRLRKATRYLRDQKAMMITNVLSPSTNYGTRSVEAAYVAVCHSDCDADIRDLPKFTHVSDYGTRKTISEYELGTCENVRFITSPDLGPWEDVGGTPTGVISTTGSSADVYPIIIFGREAFGTVALRGYGSISPKIVPVGKLDKADPLGQRGTVGWKTYHAAIRLNETWMTRIEVAVSDLLG